MRLSGEADKAPTVVATLSCQPPLSPLASNGLQSTPLKRVLLYPTYVSVSQTLQLRGIGRSAVDGIYPTELSLHLRERERVRERE